MVVPLAEFGIRLGRYGDGTIIFILEGNLALPTQPGPS